MSSSPLDQALYGLQVKMALMVETTYGEVFSDSPKPFTKLKNDVYQVAANIVRRLGRIGANAQLVQIVELVGAFPGEEQSSMELGALADGKKSL